MIVVNVATRPCHHRVRRRGTFLRALGAKKMDIMLKVGIPRFDALFLRLAEDRDHRWPLFGGSVISETIAANSGLGYMMAFAQSQFNVAAGLRRPHHAGDQRASRMYALMAWIEMRSTKWAHRSQTMGI